MLKSELIFNLMLAHFNPAESVVLIVDQQLKANVVDFLYGHFINLDRGLERIFM